MNNNDWKLSCKNKLKTREKLITDMGYGDIDRPTPIPFVIEMCSYVEEKQSSSNRPYSCVDFACGWGTFLIVHFEMLQYHFPNEDKIELFKSCIHGYDIDKHKIKVVQNYFIKELNSNNDQDEITIQEIVENNIVHIDSLNEFSKKQNNMKFDFAVGNPPYQKGKHLEFLEKAYEICDHLIFVHPAEWLVQKRKIGKNSSERIYYRGLRDKLNDRCNKIIFIDSPWGKDVQLWVPLTITFISKEKTDGIEFINNERNICSNHFYNEGFTEKLKSIHDIHRFGKGYIANSIVEKVHNVSKKSNWREHLEKKYGNFYISLPNFTGHAQKMDYQTVPNFLGKDRIMCATFSIVDNFNVLSAPLRSKPQGPGKEGNIKPWFSFETHEEAKNALDFLGRTKFVRAFLSIIKINQHAADSLLAEMPWLDWKQQWTDEKINEMMGFNEEEIEWIEMAFNKISK